MIRVKSLRFLSLKSPLISVEAANSQLSALKFLDCSWKNPTPLVKAALVGRNLRQDVIDTILRFFPNSNPYKYIYMPAPTPVKLPVTDGIGSFVRFDLNALKRENRFNTPPLEIWNAYLSKLGIQASDTLVCYDQEGVTTSPRVWWLLQQFGHKDVKVLDGGLPAWLNASLPLTPSRALTQSEYESNGEVEGRTIDHASLFLYTVDFSYHTPYTILDAREKVLFESGRDDQEKYEQRVGFIPAAKNIPASSLIGDDGLFLKGEELDKMFQEMNVDLNDPICTMADTGVEAAILNLAIDVANQSETKVLLYDGGFSEWVKKKEVAVKFYEKVQLMGAYKTK